jgi:hypothetical protein
MGWLLAGRCTLAPVLRLFLALSVSFVACGRIIR